MSTIKELKVLVDDLRKDLITQTSVIDTLKAKMATEHDNYQRKIDNLELKLSTAANASSTATLDAVTRFYNSLDAKVDKHNIRLNIIEEDTLPSVEEALRKHKTNLDTINQNEHGDINVQKLIDDI